MTNQNTSFGKAFKEARSTGNKTFIWKGKSYSTNVKGESSKSSKSLAPKPVKSISNVTITGHKSSALDRVNKIAGKTESKPMLGVNSKGQFTPERENAMGVRSKISISKNNYQPNQAQLIQGGRTATNVQESRNKEGVAKEAAKKDRELRNTTMRAIPLVTGAMLWPEATALSIAGGYGVDKGSQALTGKTWGQNVSNKTGVPEIVGDFTNPGIWAGGFAGSRLATKAAENAAVKSGATLLEGKYYKPSGSVPTTTKLTTQSRLTNPNWTKGSAKTVEDRLNNVGTKAQKSVSVTEGSQKFGTNNWMVGGKGSKGSVSGGTQGAGRQGAARISNSGAGNQKGLGFGNQSTSTRDLIARTTYKGQAPDWVEVPTSGPWLPSHIQLPSPSYNPTNLPVGGPLPQREQSVVAGQPISIEEDFGQGVRKGGFRIGKYSGKMYIDSVAPNVSSDVRNRPAAYEKQVAPLINRSGANPVVRDSSQISLLPIKNEIRNQSSPGELNNKTTINMPNFSIKHTK